MTAAFVLITISACQPAAREDLGRTTHSTSVNTDADQTWDVIHIADQPIGYQTTQWAHADVAGQVFRDISYRSVLRIKRFQQPVEETIEIQSRETADGELVSFSSSMSSGATPIRSTGRRVDGNLELTTEAGGKQQSWRLAVPESCSGPFAVEFSLMNQPMQPGQRRRLTAVVPVLNLVAPIDLQAESYEVTELLDGTQELLLIVSLTQLPQESLRTLLWCDSQGQVIKASVPKLQQNTYRVSKQRALSERGGSFDLASSSIVPIDPPLPSSHSTQRVVYRATLVDGNPAKVFIDTPYQKLTPENERTAVITVTRVDPNSDPPPANDPPPSDSDRNPSAMIQSDDARIRQLADSIVETDGQWATAVAIERFVHEYVTAKDFSTAFATAADVARERSGDCTEHAVLTAALCRARGIPARVIVGLVYVSKLQGFGFHMWNEVWMGDRWVPIDATTGRGGVGATHLALSRTSLGVEDSFASFLPVVQVIGRLRLEVLQAE